MQPEGPAVQRKGWVRRILKVLGYVVGVVLVLILLVLLYVLFAFPKSEAPLDITVERTPERIERGRYLFHHVTQCADCHAVGDEIGKENWVEWVQEEGSPFFPPNITPAALGDWTDGEIARAISSGIRKDGKALFPAMPYENYVHLTRGDLESLVAYVRTLEPIAVEHPRERLGLPFSVIARLLPRPAHPVDRPLGRGPEHGQYLTTIGGCAFCHIPGFPPFQEHDKAFQGGNDFGDDEWIIRPANLTPDSATGLGTWTKERFVARFRGVAGRVSRVPVPGGGEGPESPMPWSGFAGMSEEDLGSIYDYLRTLEPAGRPFVRIERRPAEE
jgi:mono/diheme cytochrome c family protein